MESQSELSKSLKKGFNSDNEKLARVFYLKQDLYFVGGGEFSNGLNTSWYPFIKLSINSSAKEKGEVIKNVLDGYTVNIDYDKINTGEIEEKELLDLSGQKNITNFYRDAKYCGITQDRDNHEVAE